MELRYYINHMSKIYSFSSNLNSSNFAAFPQKLSLQQIEQLIRGLYQTVNFPVIFKHSMGRKKLTDLLDTGHPSFFLISDRFLQILQDNHLTGWETYPIILLDKNNQQIPGYHGFSITGTSDSKNFSESKIIEKKFVEHGPIVKFYKGFTIRPHGDFDFFIPPHTTGFCISEKTAVLLKKNNITNVELEDAENYEIDCSIVDC